MLFCTLLRVINADQTCNFLKGAYALKSPWVLISVYYLHSPLWPATNVSELNKCFSFPLTSVPTSLGTSTSPGLTVIGIFHYLIAIIMPDSKAGWLLLHLFPYRPIITLTSASRTHLADFPSIHWIWHCSVRSFYYRLHYRYSKQVINNAVTWTLLSRNSSK